MMTISRTLTPHARTRFENLAPKYLYQEIFVNCCLVLLSIHNHLLYPENPVLLQISGMQKNKEFETNRPQKP